MQQLEVLLLETRKESSLFRVTGWHKHYPNIVNGKGIYIVDDDGRRYLDAIGGTHVNTIGYGVEEVGEAMAEQAKAMPFVHKAVFGTEVQEALASLIAGMAPATLNRVTFATGGSTANEMAIQMAQYYQMEKGNCGRRKIIARWHSYHGRTIATLSLSGNMFVRRNLPLSQLDFPHIPAPHCYQCPLKQSYPGCNLACADMLGSTIEQEGPQSIAAFIAEPIIGGAGSAIVPPPGYYERVRQICDQHDILFIAEEVITGFGRTGKNFGCEHWDGLPDIITSAKALSSGFAPIASIVVSDHVADTLINGKRKGIPTFVTYSGHPISCAAALAVQKYMQRHNLIERAASRGEYLKAALQRLAEQSELIGDVRGKGLMIGVEFVQEKQRHTPFPRDHALVEQITKTALSKGLVLRGQPGTGVTRDGDHILITPPLIITEAECDELVARLGSALDEVSSQSAKERRAVYSDRP